MVTSGMSPFCIIYCIAAVSALPPNYSEIEDDVLYEFIIEQLIQQQLLAQQQEALSKLNQLGLENEGRSQLHG